MRLLQGLKGGGRCETALLAWRQNPDAGNTRVLCKALETLHRDLPPASNPATRTALAGFAERIQLAHYDALRDEFVRQLSKQLSKMPRESGSKQDYSITLELGPALSLFGQSLGVTTKGTLLLRFGVAETNNFELARNLALTVDVKGEAGLSQVLPLKLGVNLNVERNSSKWLSSCDALAREIADALLSELASGNLKSLIQAKPYRQVAPQLQKVQLQVLGLHAALRKLHLLGDHETLALKATAYVHPNSTVFSRRTLGGEVRLGTAGLELSATRTKAVSTRRKDMLDSWKQDPASIPAKYWDNLRFNFPADALLPLAMNAYLNNLGRSMDPWREVLKAEMRAVHQEFMAYQKEVGLYKSKPSASAGARKAKLENARGVRGRQAYTQIMTATYAVLAQQYQRYGTNASGPDKAFDQLQNLMEKDFRAPNLGWDAQQTANNLTVPSVNHGSIIQAKATFSFEFKGVSLAVDLDYAIRENLSTPVFDGHFLEVSVLGTAGLDLNQEFIVKLKEKIQGELRGKGVELATEALPLDPSLGFSLIAGISLRWGKGLDGKYHLHHQRAMAQVDLKAGLSANIHGIQLGVSGTRSDIRTVKEYVGAGTLEYWLLKYEGWKLERETEWRTQYLPDHRREMTQLCINMVQDRHSLIRHELRTMSRAVDGEKKGQAYTLRKTLLRAAESVARNPNDPICFEKVCRALADFFAAYHPVVEAEENRRFMLQQGG
jgi:hypothetical protein